MSIKGGIFDMDGTLIDSLVVQGEIWVFEDSYVALLSAKKGGVKTVGIFDKYNYGQDILKENADEYIAEGETLTKLID